MTDMPEIQNGSLHDYPFLAERINSDCTKFMDQGTCMLGKSELSLISNMLDNFSTSYAKNYTQHISNIENSSVGWTRVYDFEHSFESDMSRFFANSCFWYSATNDFFCSNNNQTFTSELTKRKMEGITNHINEIIYLFESSKLHEGIELLNNLNESERIDLTNDGQSMDEKLKISEANWKRLIDQNSEIMSGDFKNILISRFNELSESGDWEVEDIPVTPESALTSLELLTHLKPKNPPYIGCDYKGNIRFDWGDANEYASFTCFPKSVIRWYIAYNKGKERVNLSGQKEFGEFRSVLVEHEKTLKEEIF